MSHDQDPAPSDELTVVRRDLGDGHADLQHVQSVVLREGPRAKKTARYVAVKNRHTGEVHHHALTLETGKKIKGSWELDDKRAISFSDEDDDEIGRLMAFLAQVRGDTAARPASPAAALQALTGDVEGLAGLVRAVREAPDAFRDVAAAMTFGRYAHGVERLKKLVAADAPADELQALFGEHPWLVGAEHGEPVDAGALGDVWLQRSPAGRLEAVVVGPAIPAGPLFEGDTPGPTLAGLIGAAMRVREALGPAGPVAVTLLVGTAADAGDLDSLERLNAHLVGIEALGYLQVLQRAQRVLDVLRQRAKGDR